MFRPLRGKAYLCLQSAIDPVDPSGPVRDEIAGDGVSILEGAKDRLRALVDSFHG